MNCLRLGVLGVSGHFINRIILPLSQSDTVKIEAIASRDLAKSSEISSRFHIPKAYGSYEALLEDSSIDAVYIPLPNHMHLEWIKKSLDAGKHVICEKPLALNVEEVIDIKDYATKSGLKLMEAFMYRFHPKWERAKEIITFKEIGEITAIHTIFSYSNTDAGNIRNIKSFGGGALMDIGCYAISTACYLMGRKPDRVISLLTQHPDFGTDVISSAILDFGKARCMFTTSTTSYPQQEVKIFGTGGSMTVTVPFNDHYDTPGELIVQNAIATRKVKFKPTNQYRLQFESFAKSIFEDLPVPVSLEDSLVVMEVIEGLFKSQEEEAWIQL